MCCLVFSALHVKHVRRIQLLFCMCEFCGHVRCMFQLATMSVVQSCKCVQTSFFFFLRNLFEHFSATMARGKP